MAALGVEKASVAIEQDHISGEGLVHEVCIELLEAVVVVDASPSLHPPSSVLQGLHHRENATNHYLADGEPW